MPARHGFTLVELMIVVAIIFILAGIAYPVVTGFSEESETSTMAMTVRRVRQQIWYHASVSDSPLAESGYPREIMPEWFEGGRLPVHPATGRQLRIQHVTRTRTEIYPETMSFEPGAQAVAETDAWYNRTNGAFCLKVPHESAHSKVLARFYEVNRLHGSDP